MKAAQDQLVADAAQFAPAGARQRQLYVVTAESEAKQVRRDTPFAVEHGQASRVRELIAVRVVLILEPQAVREPLYVVRFAGKDMPGIGVGVALVAVFEEARGAPRLGGAVTRVDTDRDHLKVLARGITDLGQAAAETP